MSVAGNCAPTVGRAYDGSAMHRSVLALSIAMGLAACGSGLEMSHARDDEALAARQWHEDVVRLAGDVDGSAARIEGEACTDACVRRASAADRTDRICEVSRQDDHDEATLYLCEDARERVARLDLRIDACSCDS